MRLFPLGFVTIVFISACSPDNTLPPTEVISLPTAAPETPTPAVTSPTSAPVTAVSTDQPEATQVATAEPTPVPTDIPDLATGSIWQLVETQGEVPAPRRDAALVYDAVRERVLLLGGRGDTGLFGDTWAFNLAARGWEQLDTGTGPQPRFSVVAGMDLQRDRFIVTTGQAGPSDFFNDGWAFDLQINSWTQLNDGSAGTWTEIGLGERPSVRQYSNLISLGNGLLLFGGEGEGCARFDDVWHLDLGTGVWRVIAPGSPPLARAGHGMVWLEDSGTAFVVGGHAPGSHLNDVWLLVPST